MGTLPGLDTPVSRASLSLGLPALPVQPLPGGLSPSAAGGLSCPHGWGGWAGAPATYGPSGHRMRSDVCWSSSAFSPGNQLNRRARSGAQPLCGMGGEAAVSPGEEGTGRTCRAPACTGFCCSSSRSPVLGARRWTPRLVSGWHFSPIMEQRWGCFMAQVVAFGGLPLPSAVGGAGAQLCLKQRCSEASRWSARTPAPEGVRAGSASHAWHGAGHKAILLLPLAVGVGRGQFRQPADSGRLLHHAPPVPQLLRRESPLQQTP